MFFGRNSQPQDPGSWEDAYSLSDGQPGGLVACYPCFVQGSTRPQDTSAQAAGTPASTTLLALVFYQPEAGKAATACKAVGHVLMPTGVTPTMLVQWWEQRGPVRLATHGQKHLNDLRGHLYGCLLKEGFDPSGAHQLWMGRHDAALHGMATMSRDKIGPLRPDKVLPTPSQEW